MKTNICVECGKEFLYTRKKKICSNVCCSKREWRLIKNKESYKKSHCAAAVKYQKNHPDEELARRVAFQKLKKENNGGYKINSKYSHKPFIVTYECPHDYLKKNNHHINYSKLLIVERLCFFCHRERHKQIKQVTK